jgi:hypothetical protein
MIVSWTPPRCRARVAECGASVAVVGSRHDHARHRRRRILLPVAVVALTTLGASGGVLWLAAHLLTHAEPYGGEERPMADVVELFKVALSVGLSRWVRTY